MIRFNNDYNQGTLPEILSALNSTNENSFAGYGTDELCEKAKAEIQKYIKCPDAKIHFFIGGTQVNFVSIAAALRPFEGIICAESAHINVHETGAVENSGHKVLALKAENAKISSDQIEKVALDFETSPVQEHIVQPKMVYLSQPTEFGTIYSKKELEEISAVCKKHGLFLYVDGARLSYALCCEENSLSLEDLAHLCDMFYIGGTKCGALFGEALVISNPILQTNFRSYIKQNGALLAKGWLLGLQFYELFKDGLYFRASKNACDSAQRIKNAFLEKGIKPYIESPTNQQFFVVSEKIKNELQKNFYFEEEGKTSEGTIIRFCTSWSTKVEEVDFLVQEINKL